MRFRPTPGRLIALVCLLSAAPASGQPFEPIGDVAFYEGAANGGRVSRIVPTSASRVFVGAPTGGVWRTLDGGGSWTTRTDRFDSLQVTALAAAPGDGRVFAATASPVRLLRSTDGGTTFVQITVPQVAFNSDAIWKLVVDPVHPATLYALTTRGLLKSVDDGDNWFEVFPPAGGFVFDVALLSGDAFHVLATRAGRLFRSATGDAGSFVEIPLPAPPDGEPPGDPFASDLVLAPVPGTPARVWIAVTGSGGAVWRSTDYGAAPSFVSRHDQSFFRDRFAASRDGTTLYSGKPQGSVPMLYRHAGGAPTGVYVPGPYHADVWAVTTTASPPHVYVGTDGGVWRYHETLGTWENLNGNMANLLVYEARTHRSDLDAIVGGTQDNGVIVHRGRDWVIAAPTDAGDGMLRTDDPSSGASFIIITTQAFVRIDGATGRAVQYLGAPPPCAVPSRGRYALDPTDPRVVCVAGGKIRCARDPRHQQWCDETEDLGFAELFVVDEFHAWATAFPGSPPGWRVMRSTTGIVGTWVDATGDLPPGTLIGLDAPERGNPLRALVLWRPTGESARVFETLDGGVHWQPRGVPPVADEGGIPLICIVPPCPMTPESGPAVDEFAVTFPRTLIPESWFVGTSRGLLESVDGGATWQDTDVPHVSIDDIETFDNVVTVATYGRGVFRRVTEPLLGDFDFIEVGPFWRLGHVPFEVPRWFASDALAELGDLVDELRLLGGGGRRFALGDEPLGPHDFPLSPGRPILLRGQGTGELFFEGTPVPQQPLALAPGWNAIGFSDAGLQSASGLVADAAAQGLQLGAVADASLQRVYFASGGQRKPGAPKQGQQDFAVKRTEGYWVYACDGGGIWTPGAGESARSPTPTARPAGRGPQTCAGFDAAVEELAAALADRLPGEFLACLEKQTFFAGNLPWTLCDSVPEVESDRELDQFACDDEPLARGCAVTVRITGVQQQAADHFVVHYDVDSNGTATGPVGERCPVKATVSGGKLDAFVDIAVDPPAITVTPLQSGATYDAVQQACGFEEDAIIADRVGEAAAQALEARVGVALTGLAPVCVPDIALPDGDADGAFDCDDGCPFDPAKTDAGACGCGVVDDLDQDQVASCDGDCNDRDATVWGVPGETPEVLAVRDPQTGQPRLIWSAPDSPGGSSTRYDVLFAESPDGFGPAPDCLISDQTEPTVALDVFVAPEKIAYLLVRATNDCPNGTGTLGSDSSGNERFAHLCP